MGCIKSKKDNEIEQKKELFDEINEEVSRFENAQYNEIDKLFHEFDVNNNNYMDGKEFTQCLDKLIKRYESNPDMKQRIIDFKDQLIPNENVILTKEKFRVLLGSVLIDNFTMNELIELFSLFDKRKDAKICSHELIHVFKNLGVNIDIEIANELVKEASYNGNEYIDFEEFARVMLSK